MGRSLSNPGDASQFTWPRPRFRLRSLLVCLAFAAVFLAWWYDQRALKEHIVRLQGPHLLGHFPQREPAILKTGANALLAFGDGSAVVCANGKSAELWEMTYGKKLLSLDHPEPVVAMALSPNEQFLLTLTAGSDSPARFWNLQSGTLVKEYPSPFAAMELPAEPQWEWRIRTPGAPSTFGFTSATFAPDGRKLATGCEDGSIIFWDTKTGNEFRKIRGSPSRIRRVVFSPDGTYLLATSEDRDVQLWDLRRDLLRMHYRHERTKAWRTAPLPLAFAPDGSKFAFCFNHTLDPVRIYSTASGVENRSFKDQSHYCSYITFLPDGKTLLTYSHVLRIQQVSTGREILRHGDRLFYAGRLFTTHVRYVQYLPAISSVMIAGVDNAEHTLHEDWTIIRIVPISSFELPEGGAL
jgi:WD40 repeat protein